MLGTEKTSLNSGKGGNWDKGELINLAKRIYYCRADRKGELRKDMKEREEGAD